MIGCRQSTCEWIGLVRTLLFKNLSIPRKPREEYKTNSLLYQTSHFSSGFIVEPDGHSKLLAKSLLFESVPMIR